MISIENVSFRYAGAETQSVSSLNLRVPKGECVLICGPSGSGKTTVARLIGGLIPRFFGGKLTGSLKLNGKDMRNMTVEEITSTVGSVFQDPRSQFFTTDTTSEMAFTCENMGVPRDEMLDRIALSSYVLDVSGLLERSIFDLSSGERQRVAIGSVHAYSPPILVFDEPTSGLDGLNLRRVSNLIRSLADDGRVVFVITHDCELVMGYCTRAIQLVDGELPADMDVYLEGNAISALF